MNGEEKVHNLVKVWFNDNGEMESSVLSSESNVKKKRGIRGSIQKNAVEDLLGILEKTINLSLNYAFLSKGNWIDLLDMAEVKNGKISF
ncbi:MAG: hypothetical protein GXO89_03360 [Chlorobi bacterium]|nr:hypothetical protein [Chlorobiota bacterium]